MTRPNEFSKGVKIAARARATVKGVMYCEGCGKPIPAGEHRVDHKIAAGLRGSAKLENAQVLGKCCYALKDATDNAVVKRCARIEKRHLNLVKKATTLRSRGFAIPPARPSPCAPTSKTLPRRL